MNVIKKISLVSILLSFSLKGYCDMIDLWQVSYNDSIVRNFNGNSKDISLKLIKSKIKTKDKLNINYKTDTPCPICKSYLTIKDENEKTIVKIEGKNYDLSVFLFSLIAFQKKNRNNKFKFYYHEDGRKYTRLVLQLEFN